MDLNVQDWQEFQIGRIFNNPKIKKYNSIPEETGNYTFISSSSENNGSVAKCDVISNSEPCITISTNGACFDCFYHDEPIAVSSDVEVLTADWLNAPIGLFLCCVIQRNQYRYCYGRKAKNNKVWETIIRLPIQRKLDKDKTPVIDPKKIYSEKGYIPDWQFMEDYIKSLNHESLLVNSDVKIVYTTEHRDSEIINGKKTPPIELNVQNWKEFKLSKLFDVSGSSTTKLENLEDIYGAGEFNYVTTSAQNNGVEGHYDHWTEEGNVITVESACMGFATYQAEKFSASDHVEILRPKFQLNMPLGIFFVTILNGENFKFSYGRKCNQQKIKNMLLKLPIQLKSDGSPILAPDKKYSNEGYIPDWNFMESYIKSLNRTLPPTANEAFRITYTWNENTETNDKKDGNP